MGTEAILLSGVSVLAGQYGTSQGGLIWSSDQITYPAELTRVGPTHHSQSVQCARIYSWGLATATCDTIFHVNGDFSASHEEATESNRVMANVRIELFHNESSYEFSRLQFNANAMHTPYGEAEDPRIRFGITGHFDPFGAGEIRFHAVLEIDQFAAVNMVEGYLTEGQGTIWGEDPHGFYVSTQYETIHDHQHHSG